MRARPAARLARRNFSVPAGLPRIDRFAKLIGMRSIPFFALVLASCFAVGGFARAATGQEAPAPDAIPVPPVATETLAPAPPMVFDGPIVALDGMTIQIDDHKFLLFGIVTPDLGLPDGLRARLALDRLIGGRSDVHCTEAPRDSGFRRRAVCIAGEVDLAEALLAEGIGFVDRFQTHLADADPALAARYDAAEAAARQAGKGVWAAFAEPPPAPIAPPPTRQERIYGLLQKWQAAAGSLAGVLVVGILMLIFGRSRRPRELPPAATAGASPGPDTPRN